MYGQTSERVWFSPVRSTRKQKCRRCNLCGEEFYLHTLFDRFCIHCKEKNELLRFSNWLPEVDETLVTRFTA